MLQFSFIVKVKMLAAFLCLISFSNLYGSCNSHTNLINYLGGTNLNQDLSSSTYYVDQDINVTQNVQLNDVTLIFKKMLK